MSDPNFNRFVNELNAESQRAKFNEQVNTLNSRCYDVCSSGSPSSKMDNKTETCISNCVNRMVDASNHMVDHMQKYNKK